MQTCKPMEQDINQHIYGQMIFSKGTKTTECSRKTLSLQQVALGKLHTRAQKNEIEPLSYSINKSRFKMDY